MGYKQINKIHSQFYSHYYYHKKLITQNNKNSKNKNKNKDNNNTNKQIPLNIQCKRVQENNYYNNDNESSKNNNNNNSNNSNNDNNNNNNNTVQFELSFIWPSLDIKIQSNKGKERDYLLRKEFQLILLFLIGVKTLIKKKQRKERKMDQNIY